MIVAAGAGTRSGAAEPKQFRWVAGKPMLLHSVQAFQARSDVALVIAVLPRRFAADPPPWLFQCDLDRLLVSTGGRERSDSVRSGLEDLPAEVEIVVVHDAARPLAPAPVIDRVIAAARSGVGAVAALPVVDTIKLVGDDGRIMETVARAGLWRAQTPQAFPRAMIERAYAAYASDELSGAMPDGAATDDAELCERLGLPVFVVPGSELALKITVEADFARAEALAPLAG